MNRHFALGLLLSILLLAGHDGATGPRVVSAQSGRALELLHLINQFRIDRGLPPFIANSALTAAAQRHANWMAANVAYTHTGDGGSTPLSRALDAGYVGFVSENIVGGTNMSPRQGLIWWENSPVHFNTLTTSRYSEAGTGYATNGSQNMYVLLVGRPDSAAASQNSNEDPSAEPLYITPIELAEPGEDGSIVHVVQQGQALWTISAYYDVELETLYLINGLAEGSFLQPGDEVTVRLPEGQEPPPTPTPPLSHTVREGESLWSVATLHGLSLERLLLLNNLSPASILQPGDELTIRLAEGQSLPPTPTPSPYHIVQSGQTLWAIAATYNLTLDELLQLNNLTAGAILQPGDELLVRRPAPTATPTQPSATPSLEPNSSPTPAAAGSNSPVEPTTTATRAPIAAALPATATGQAPSPVPLAAGQDQDQSSPAGAITTILALSLVASAVIVVVRRRMV